MQLGGSAGPPLAVVVACGGVSAARPVIVGVGMCLDPKWYGPGMV